MSNEEVLIRNIVKQTIKEMETTERKRKIKDKNSYQKTEQVLFDYNNYKKAVSDKYEQIEDIKEYGISKTSGSIIGMPTGTNERLTDNEKADVKIEALQNAIATTKLYIKFIDDALEEIKSDKYYDVIPMIYFEGCTLEYVADKFGVDEKTIRRRRSKLVNTLSVLLFSADVIYELYG